MGRMGGEPNVRPTRVEKRKRRRATQRQTGLGVVVGATQSPPATSEDLLNLVRLFSNLSKTMKSMLRKLDRDMSNKLEKLGKEISQLSEQCRSLQTLKDQDCESSTAPIPLSSVVLGDERRKSSSAPISTTAVLGDEHRSKSVESSTIPTQEVFEDDHRSVVYPKDDGYEYRDKNGGTVQPIMFLKDGKKQRWIVCRDDSDNLQIGMLKDIQTGGDRSEILHQRRDETAAVRECQGRPVFLQQQRLFESKMKNRKLKTARYRLSRPQRSATNRFNMGQNNVALGIMLNMGWIPGETLGKNKRGLLRPIEAGGQLGRAGIGFIESV